LIKVVFFVHSMEGGGAERVVSRLINHLDRSQFSPYLVLMEKKGPYLKYIPADVPIYELGIKETNPLLLPKLLFRLRQILKSVEPDLLFSVLWYANISAVMASRGLPVKAIISERIWTPFEISERTGGKFLRFIKKSLLKSIYPFADHVVAVSAGIAAELEKNFGVPSQRISVIHNPALDNSALAQADSQEDPWKGEKGFRIISMGRLESQKGHDVLIRAIAKLPEELMLNVKVLGEGPERQNLERLVRDFGLESRVRLEGFQSNPYTYLKFADLFVLPSRAEGFPNALLEAMSFNLPVIAADCSTGPREILQDGAVAPLFAVDDVDGLAKELSEIVQDATRCDRCRGKVRMRIRDFDTDEIWGCYKKLFLSVLASTNINNLIGSNTGPE
jgi:glycosyltransferase involved in cell wall biosynthesis